MPSHDEIVEAAAILIEAARGFYDKNWMLGTSGNLSLKMTEETDPEGLQYLITASGPDKGALTPDDFVLVGKGGIALQPPQAKSSAETLLHEAVYQSFPDVVAVYHVHTVTATLLSIHATDDNQVLTFSNLEMIKGLGFDTHDVTIELPVFENSQDIAALSQAVRPQLNPNVPGFLIKGHGLYAWGKSPFEAKRHVEIWEYLFQFKLMERMLQVNPQAASQ
jgi:methylthioribulose-1-phosphate dehydratase